MLDRLLRNADFLHFRECKLLILLNPNFEKCSSVTACRNRFQVKLRELFKDNKYSLRLVGIVSQFAEEQNKTYGNLKFDPLKEESFKMIVDFLDGEPGDIDQLQRVIEEKIGKPVTLIPWAEFKNKDSLDMGLTILRIGPERRDIISNPAHFKKDWESLDAKKNQ